MNLKFINLLTSASTHMITSAVHDPFIWPRAGLMTAFDCADEISVLRRLLLLRPRRTQPLPQRSRRQRPRQPRQTGPRWESLRMPPRPVSATPLGCRAQRAWHEGVSSLLDTLYRCTPVVCVVVSCIHGPINCTSWCRMPSVSPPAPDLLNTHAGGICTDHGYDFQ